MKRELIILVLSLLTGIATAVDIQHVAPQSYIPGEDLQLMLEVQQGLEDVLEISLNHRLQGDTRWMQEKAVQKTPGAVNFWAVIPAKYLNDLEVEYYFTIALAHGTTQDFPAQGGLTPNYKVLPKGMTGELSNGFVLLSGDEATHADDGYLLVVSFFELADEIDPQSIEVWVGGKNVTAFAQISSPTILYREDKPQPGIKKVVIKATQGIMEIHSPIWVTEVLPGSGKSAPTFTSRGSVNFASHYYHSSLDENTYRLPRSDAAAWTDLYGSYGIVDMVAKLYVSSWEKSNMQPVNRYTLGLQIPYLDIYAGDYSPLLSQYTLYNKNIKGIYARLHSRFVSLLFAHGQSVRKTTNETNLSPVPDLVLKSGTFKQEAMGGRLQIGNENEVMLGFNFSRHRDIVSSLDKEYYMLVYTAPDQLVADTLYSVTPRDNLVLSTDFRVNVPAQNVIIGTEIAGSMMNKNIQPGTLTANEIENWTGQNIPFDPSDFSDLIIINKNMEPFKLSSANLAWTAYLRTLVWNNYLNIQYSETGPAFNAFGASYLMNDCSTLSISDQMNLYRYLALSAGFNLTKDNFMKYKSERNIYSNWFAQSIIRIPRAPYIKLAYYNNHSENEDNPKIINDPNLNPFNPYTHDSANLALGIGYNFEQLAMMPTQVDISYKMGSDEYKTEALNGSEADNTLNGINFNMYNHFANLPLSTQFSMSINNQNHKLLDNQNSNQSYFLGAAYGLWDNKLKPFANYRIVNLDQNNTKSNYGYFTLGVEAYPLKNFNVTTDLGFTSFSSDATNTKDYNNTTWQVLLTQRF